MADISIAAVAAGAAVVSAVSQAMPIVSSNKANASLDDLKKAVAELRSNRKSYQNEVQIHKMKVSSDTRKEWIGRVMETEEQVATLIAKCHEESEKSYFLSGPSTDFSEKIKKKHKEVIELLKESNQIPDEPRVVKKRAADIKKFETLQNPLEQVLGFLGNDKVKVIRIQGTVGIGKTTIMQNLNNHEKVANMFDIVIWVNVSEEESMENLSTTRLQQTLLQRLNLNMKGTNHDNEVANRIAKELEGKKYLLLMDNVKKDLNLSEVGIPFGKNGSKIVLTSRCRTVCSSLVDMPITVKELSKKEAWQMFRDILECSKVLENPKIWPFAYRICKECGGLPLLIEKVANTFKVKHSECLWKEGLNSWRTWPEKYCQGIRELYKIFKFCYNDLDEHQKKCFLYGALHPEGTDIYEDCLLECWVAEDFVGSDHAHHILRHLKEVSLIEESDSGKSVTMQNFIRQVALYISSDDPNCKYLVKTNSTSQEPPNAESWSQKNCISLGKSKFDQLPDSPDCSMLSTLFLQDNSSLETVPASFFDHMKNLRVLDFCKTRIMSLPSSLSKLISLKVLYLCDCESLIELPCAIGELPHLEVLDIRGSGIHDIPAQIEKLRGLRCLRISYPKSGNVNGTQEMDLSQNIISKLCALEELVIDMKSSDQWSNKVVVENIIKEVATLERLTTLRFCFPDWVVDVIEVRATSCRVHFPDASILQTFIDKRSLWRKVEHIKPFQLVIASQNLAGPKIPEFYEYDCYIQYCNGEGTNPPIPEVFTKADAFELLEHKDIRQLTDLGVASMNQVRVFLIESCNEIETIIEGVNGVDCKILSNLEHLYMKNLPKLKSIWKDPMQSVSLTNLKRLVLSCCQILESIFPPGVIQQLCEMQYLEIENCSKIVEIFGESETTRYPYVLPKLKELILIDMPKLEFICANELLNWPSLEKLQSCNCPKLHGFPVTRAPKLKLCKIERCPDFAL